LHIHVFLRILTGSIAFNPWFGAIMPQNLGRERAGPGYGVDGEPQPDALSSFSEKSLRFLQPPKR